MNWKDAAIYTLTFAVSAGVSYGLYYVFVKNHETTEPEVEPYYPEPDPDKVKGQPPPASF